MSDAQFDAAGMARRYAVHAQAAGQAVRALPAYTGEPTIQGLGSGLVDVEGGRPVDLADVRGRVSAWAAGAEVALTEWQVGAVADAYLLLRLGRD